MGINYAKLHAKQIDEAFSLASITDIAVTFDYDFTKADTIIVHSVPTVPMRDYERFGTQRYGIPNELEDERQLLQVTQDRAFTFTIDAGNESDNPALDAGRALRRQIDLELAPEVDRYRLAKMVVGAGATFYGGYGRTGSSGAYERFIDLNGEMDAHDVPDDRIAFVTSDFLKRLKLDRQFVQYSSIGQNLLIKGQIGMAEGVRIIKAAGRLPRGVACVVIHPLAVTAPFKMDSFTVKVNPPGISGALVEGRSRYDAYVMNMKKNAVVVLRGSMLALHVTNETGGSGVTRFAAVSGYTGEREIPFGTLVYRIAEQLEAPAFGSDISDVSQYPELTIGAGITCNPFERYIVALKDQHGKCIGASDVGAVLC